MKDYATAQQIIDANPEIKNFWTANDIGGLLRMKLVKGVKLVRGSVLYIPDVIRIFKQVIKS